MKAVAYYRTRPSEPEASETALRLQREAVRKEVENGELTLIAEFTEQEGERDPETYPAFVAAVRAAVGHSSDERMLDVAFIVASVAAIGTGEPFEQPFLPGGHRLFWIDLQTPSIAAQTEIPLPEGAPGPLCLHAIFRPRQRDTLVYLCNAGPEPLHNVTIVYTAINMHTFFAVEGDEQWVDGRTGEKHRGVIPPGTCVQIGHLDHIMWDFVCRYQLTFADAEGRSWAAEAHDCDLRIDMPRSERAWVEFSSRVDAPSSDSTFG